MSIDERQQAIIEEFAFFDEWMDKYEHIIDYGKKLEAMDEALKVDQHLVKGCQSRVWLFANTVNDRMRFVADSDAVITRGLVALMVHVLDNQPPKDIANAELYFIDRIGLKEHLSPNRANGLVSMVKKMKAYAVANQ